MLKLNRSSIYILTSATLLLKTTTKNMGVVLNSIPVPTYREGCYETKGKNKKFRPNFGIKNCSIKTLFI